MYQSYFLKLTGPLEARALECYAKALKTNDAEYAELLSRSKMEFKEVTFVREMVTCTGGYTWWLSCNIIGS